MGLFSRIAARRRAKESAFPDPDSAEFQDTVSASELPGSTGQLGVSPDEWTSAQQLPSQSFDLRGTGAREEMLAALQRHGVDPEQEGQTLDPSQVPGLQEEIVEILQRHGLNLDGEG